MSPVLTVRQPFALALVRGVKRWENRSWSRDLSESDGWIWIHAAMAHHAMHREAAELWPDMPPLAEMVRSAIVGAVRIGEVRDYADVAGEPWTCAPPPGKRGLCWRVVDNYEVDPVPCSGGLGLWTPSRDLAAGLSGARRAA